MSESFAAAASPRVHPSRWATACLWLACAAFGPAAHGQPTASTAGRAADPADAGATVPALVYRSPLPVAARATPVDASTWRDANQTAARIGGWRAYLREAQTPEAVPTPTPSPTPPMHKH